MKKFPEQIAELKARIAELETELAVVAGLAWEFSRTADDDRRLLAALRPHTQAHIQDPDPDANRRF